MTSQQYNQVPASFTPPTTGSGFSFGTDFVPAWLQINNPSSYYLTFPGHPQTLIAPYVVGVIIPWGVGPGNIVISTDYVPNGAPSLPSSNAEVNILATDNPHLGTDPGTPLPIFEQGKVVWAPLMSGTGASFTYTPHSNATGIAFMSVSNDGANLLGVSVTGNTTSYPYISQSMSGGLADAVWFTSPIIGGFEPLVLSYSCANDPGQAVGYFIELYGNQLTIPAPPVSQPTIVAGPSTFNPVTGGDYPPVTVTGNGLNVASLWNSATYYPYGSIVFITTGTAPGYYYCMVANTNVEPPNTADWVPMTLTLVA